MNTTTSTEKPALTGELSLPWACGILICAGLVAFWNGLEGEFVFDDVILVAHDTLFHHLWPWGPMLDLHRCFANWTFQWNYAYGREQVLGYHVVNIGIHLAAGLTLFDLARRLLLLPGIPLRLAAQSTWLALAIALVWLVHPLQTEAVTYVVQRYESLMGLCFLLVLYCTLRGSLAQRAWPWYLAAIAAAWAGAASKEVMAACPLVLLLFDRAYLASSWLEALRKRWWVYLCVLASVPWMFWAVRHAFDPDNPTGGAGAAAGLSAWQYLRSQPGVILYYLRLTAWPDELILDRGWPIARSPLAIYGLGAVILALLALSFWALWRWPKVGFLGLSFFLILAPTSTIIPLSDLAVEHRMYLPLAPLLALVVLGAVELAYRLNPVGEGQGRWLLAALGIVVFVFTLRTIRRNSDYVHSEQLWEQVVEYNPKHARGHRFLARCYLQKQRYDEALAHYEQSVSLQPRVFQTWVEYGALFFQQKNYAEARRRFEQAARINPQSFRAWMNIGRTHLIEGNYAAALAASRRAMEAEPGEPTARKQVAWILAAAPDDSIRNGREALELVKATPPHRQPVDFQHLEVLAAAHAEVGQFDEAIRVAEQGLAAARRYDPRRQQDFSAWIKQYQSRQPHRLETRQPGSLTAAPAGTRRGA